MLAYFPSGEGEEPATRADLQVTKAELRAEMADLRTEMADLRTEMAQLGHDLERSMRSMTVWMSASTATAIVGGMGLAAVIT